MILKIIAMGFIMRAHSYLRDPWNIVSILFDYLKLIPFKSSYGRDY